MQAYNHLLNANCPPICVNDSIPKLVGNRFTRACEYIPSFSGKHESLFRNNVLASLSTLKPYVHLLDSKLDPLNARTDQVENKDETSLDSCETSDAVMQAMDQLRQASALLESRRAQRLARKAIQDSEDQDAQYDGTPLSSEAELLSQHLHSPRSKRRKGTASVLDDAMTEEADLSALAPVRRRNDPPTQANYLSFEHVKGVTQRNETDREASAANLEEISEGTEKRNEGYELSYPGLPSSGMSELTSELYLTPSPRAPLSRVTLGADGLEKACSPRALSPLIELNMSDAQSIGVMEAKSPIKSISEHMNRTELHEAEELTREKDREGISVSSRFVSPLRKSRIASPPRSNNATKLRKTYVEQKQLKERLKEEAPEWSIFGGISNSSKFGMHLERPPEGMTQGLSVKDLEESQAFSRLSFDDGDFEEADFSRRQAEKRKAAKERADSTVKTTMISERIKLVTKAKAAVQRQNARQVIERVAKQVDPYSDLRSIICAVHRTNHIEGGLALNNKSGDLNESSKYKSFDSRQSHSLVARKAQSHSFNLSQRVFKSASSTDPIKQVSNSAGSSSGNRVFGNPKRAQMQESINLSKDKDKHGIANVSASMSKSRSKLHVAPKVLGKSLHEIRGYSVRENFARQYQSSQFDVKTFSSRARDTGRDHSAMNDMLQMNVSDLDDVVDMSNIAAADDIEAALYWESEEVG